MHGVGHLLARHAATRVLHGSCAVLQILQQVMLAPLCGRVRCRYVHPDGSWDVSSSDRHRHYMCLWRRLGRRDHTACMHGVGHLTARKQHQLQQFAAGLPVDQVLYVC